MSEPFYGRVSNFCTCLFKPLEHGYGYALARFLQTFIKNLTRAEWIRIMSLAPRPDMETKIVTIDLGVRSYDIYIGSGLLYRFADFVPVELDGRSVFIVTDRNVEPYAAKIRDMLLDDGAVKVEMLTLPPGEKIKSYAQMEKSL